MANPNVFQALIQPQRSVLEYGADLDRQESTRLALEGQRRQNSLAALTEQQTRTQISDTAAKRNALQQVAAGWGAGTTDDQRIASLRGNPLTFDAADSLERSTLERGKAKSAAAKDQADADAKTAEIKWKLADRHSQRLSMVQTPQDAAAWVEEGIREGSLPPEGRDRAMQMIQQGGVEAWKQMASQAAVPVLERFKTDAEMKRAQLTADTQIKTNAATNATSRATNAATVGATMAGQRSTAATAAAGQVETARHNQATEAAASGKGLNDSQSKALLFGSRMRDSDQILRGLARQGTDQPGALKRMAESIPLVGDGAGVLMNWSQSGEQQRVEQAQRDFVNAVLRRESGASISPSEFDNAKKQYFPQPNDDEATKAQKAQSRDLAIQGMLAEVPEGQRSSIGKPAAKRAPLKSIPPGSVIKFDANGNLVQ